MEVRKPTKEEIQNTLNWEIWKKEVSVFPWEYDKKETCYILEGKAEVTSESGDKIIFTVGDYVIFQKGLKCTWVIIEPIKKRFSFG